jgi:signal transduction histidine kinase
MSANLRLAEPASERRSSSSTPRRLMFGLAICLLCWVATTWMEFDSLADANAAAEWVERTQEIRLGTERLRLAVRVARSSVANELLTPNAGHRAEYDNTQAAAAHTLDQLEELANDPTALALASAIRRDFQALNTLLMAALADPSTSRAATAAALVQPGPVASAMARLLEDLAALEEIERNLLASRNEVESGERKQVVIATVAGNATALVLVAGLLIALARRPLHERIFSLEQQQRSLSARLEGTLASMAEGMLIVDRDSGVQFANEHAAMMLMRSRADLIGASVTDVLQAAGGGESTDAVRRVLRGGAGSTWEFFSTGSNLWLELRLLPAPDRLMVFLRDVSARHHADETLRRRDRELHRLSHQLLRAQEDQRSNLARELHDELGQELVALKMLLESNDREGRLAPASAAVDRLIGVVRSRSLDLHPAVLDDLGLREALLWLCSRMRKSAAIDIRVECDEDLPRFDEDLETTLFRIAQESLTNSLKHARASRIVINVSQTGGLVNLVVDDDGQGLSADGGQRSGGLSLGLVSMRERAALIGARLRVETSPLGGVRVHCAVGLASRLATPFDREPTGVATGDTNG